MVTAAAIVRAVAAYQGQPHQLGTEEATTAKKSMSVPDQRAGPLPGPSAAWPAATHAASQPAVIARLTAAVRGELDNNKARQQQRRVPIQRDIAAKHTLKLRAPGLSSGLSRALRRLLDGKPLRLVTVGGSAAAGAGGTNINMTFDAQLALRLNSVLDLADPTSRLGRVERRSVAQGGTCSFWAALLADTLYSDDADVLVWEFGINDAAIAAEAARDWAAPREAAAETMAHMLDLWLRRVLGRARPPAVLLTYLWDKLGASNQFKKGNLTMCRVATAAIPSPIPGKGRGNAAAIPASAFAAQRSVIRRYIRAGADLTAVDVAGYSTLAINAGHGRTLRFCQSLVSDEHYHPSWRGHEFISALLATTVLERLLALLGEPPSRPLQPDASSMPLLLPAPANTRAPCRGASASACALSDAVSTLLLRADGRPPRIAARLAWLPRYGLASLPLIGEAPPLQLFAASVRGRADRKWSFVLPRCSEGRPLSVRLPFMWAALTFYAMVSPGSQVVHNIDGRRVHFGRAHGSFLAQSWGYYEMWLLAADENNGSRWELCSAPVADAKCTSKSNVHGKCGLEFRMPKRTAAVSWVAAVVAQ